MRTASANMVTSKNLPLICGDELTSSRTHALCSLPQGRRGLEQVVVAVDEASSEVSLCTALGPRSCPQAVPGFGVEKQVGCAADPSHLVLRSSQSCTGFRAYPVLIRFSW